MEKISVKWNANPAVVKRLTDSYLKRNLANINDNLTYFADNAAEHIVKESILKGSPTGSMWHRMINKERGNEFGARYETGQMSRNVGFLPSSEIGDGQMLSEFGLFTGGDNYFMRQEYGFKLQVKNGTRPVKGMFSARKAMKATRPLFRKKMLSSGFLRGKTDTRGRAVLMLMSYGENFDQAWGNTGRDMSEAQRQAYNDLRIRIAQSQIARATVDAKWANNRRVIDALEFGTKYAQAEYRNQRGG